MRFSGLIGGALADRWDRQRMMIVTQSLMALCAAALAVVAYLHVDSIVGHRRDRVRARYDHGVQQPHAAKR